MESTSRHPTQVRWGTCFTRWAGFFFISFYPSLGRGEGRIWLFPVIPCIGVVSTFVFLTTHNRTQAFESMHAHALGQSPDFKHFLNFVEKSERGVVAGR